MRWSFDYKTDHRLRSLNFSPEMNTINNKVQAAESDSLKLKQFTKQMLFGYLGLQQPAEQFRTNPQFGQEHLHSDMTGYWMWIQEHL